MRPDATFSLNTDSEQAENLLYWWPFTANSTNLLDYSGNELHGTMHNIEIEEDDEFGRVGVFDGETSYVSFDGYPGVITFPFFLTAWVKPDWTNLATNETSCLVSRGYDALSRYSYQLGPHISSGIYTTLFRFRTTADGSVANSNVGFPALEMKNKWTHVAACRFTSGYSVWYINGMNISGTGGGPVVTDPYAGDLRLFIGAALSSDQHTMEAHFKGRVADLRIYGGSRTAEELFRMAADGTRWELYKTPLTGVIHPAQPAYTQGEILGQVVNFNGSKTIHKVSLNLNVTASDRKEYIQGSDGVVSFSAANFQDSRDAWIFQPTIHWPNWDTHATSIQNTLQTEEYVDSEDALANAPYLEYWLYFDVGGTFDMWGYGYANGDGIFWTFDEDTTDIRSINLGNDDAEYTDEAYWTKFGTIFLEEGGVHTFRVYLRGLHTVLLDQWYFTTDTDLVDEIEYQQPLPLSTAPFMTAVRLRSIVGGQVDSLESPMSGAESITAWLSSKNIAASGKFNYEIRNNPDSAGVTFEDGLSIEYWQIGGNREYFAAWELSFPDDSVGDTFSSKNFGQTYE